MSVLIDISYPHVIISITISFNLIIHNYRGNQKFQWLIRSMQWVHAWGFVLDWPTIKMPISMKSPDQWKTLPGDDCQPSPVGLISEPAMYRHSPVSLQAALSQGQLLPVAGHYKATPPLLPLSLLPPGQLPALCNLLLPPPAPPLAASLAAAAAVAAVATSTKPMDLSSTGCRSVASPIRPLPRRPRPLQALPPWAWLPSAGRPRLFTPPQLPPASQGGSSTRHTCRFCGKTFPRWGWLLNNSSYLKYYIYSIIKNYTNFFHTIDY